MKEISHSVRPIRTITQICVVTRHQYGILRSFLRRHFAGKPDSGDVAKYWLFSQSFSLFVTRNLNVSDFFFLHTRTNFVIRQHYQNKNIAKHELAVLHFQSLFVVGQSRGVSGPLTLKSQFGHIVSGQLQ